MRISVWSSDVCSSYLAINGLREIDPDTSAIVIRIFTEYAAGRSARQIPEDLNKDRISPPSGEFWQVNTLPGSPTHNHRHPPHYTHPRQRAVGLQPKRNDPPTRKGIGNTIGKSKSSRHWSNRCV